jgi:formylglycine-generating enzyme required for sulfatase activity
LVTALVITEPVNMELVRVPAGEFLMGSDPQIDVNANDGEQPQHTLVLPEFFISKYEVTNAQYEPFVRAMEAAGNRSHTPFYWWKGKLPEGEEEYPVVYVSWDDAVAYGEWLSAETGMVFRLPNEAEWEKACRGTDGRIYPWGNSLPDTDMVNYDDNVGAATQVGTYSPQGDSPYGLADMAGNVWEWTNSGYADYPFDPEDGREDMEIEVRAKNWAEINEI